MPDNAGNAVSRETRATGPAPARRKTRYFPTNPLLPLPEPMPPRNPLPGLGPRSWAMLAAAGIKDQSTLERLGSVNAYLQVLRAGQPASLNLLWALEGALTGQHWQTVAREERARLLLTLDAAQQCLPPP